MSTTGAFRPELRNVKGINLSKRNFQKVEVKQKERERKKKENTNGIKIVKDKKQRNGN